MAKKNHQFKLKAGAALFPGLSDLTIGHGLRADLLIIVKMALTPLMRGLAIQKAKPLTACRIEMLHGPLEFVAPELTVEGIREHIAMLLFHSRDVNAVKATAMILQFEFSETIADCLTAAKVSPDFVSSFLANRVDEAEKLLVTTDWPEEFDEHCARDLLRRARILQFAMKAQLDAAFAWKMRHEPFNNVLGERNLYGASTIGKCLGGYNIRLKDFRRVADLYKSGADNVSKTSFKFLDRYQLGWLRNVKPKDVYSMFGQSRIPQLPQIMEDCEKQADTDGSIIGSIGGVALPGNDNGGAPSAVDYRSWKPDSFLCPASVVVLLAISCAQLASMVGGASEEVAWSVPPKWLTSKKSLTDHDRLEKTRFLRIFMLYRGLIARDHPQAAVDPRDWREHKIDPVDYLCDLPAFKTRPFRSIVDAMRADVTHLYRVQNGLGTGPLPIDDFRASFGWKKAS